MLNKLKEMRESREEGFTLIELLVVIVIIGVLAAIALPIFLNQQKAAIAAGVKSDVRNTVAAVATEAVKKPSFTAVIATGTPTAAQIVVAPSVSDASTVITIGSVIAGTAAVPTGLSGAAAWNNYKVWGFNANAGSATGFGYMFDSTTGKYTTNDAVAGPVVP